MNDHGPTFTIRPGVSGTYKGRQARVQAIVGPDRLLIFENESSNGELIRMDEFSVGARASDASSVSIHDGNDRWEAAERRYAIIEPLLNASASGKVLCLEDVKQCAASAGVHFTTLYRWKRKYDDSGGRLSSLQPSVHKRGGRKKLLAAAQEIILRATIDEVYLTEKHPTQKATHAALVERCSAAGLIPPHYNTLRKRIAEIPDRQRLARRARRKEANDTYEPRPGQFIAQRPWQVVQIDSTIGDIQLVDETHRREIGRPTITAAIDVFSRMVVGIYVSFEKVSANSVGLCLTNAMFPKGPWLAELDVRGEWPCFGRPVAIHADNGMEHRSNMLRRACSEYNITLEFRALKSPEWGGHIESFMKTMNNKIHELPGSTFSNVQKKAEYPSEKRAQLTLREFTRWLVQWIVGEYHEGFHSGINGSPKERYAGAFLRKGDELPIALPEVFDDPDGARMNFMPAEMRTVQQYGVLFWYIRYYHPILAKFINASSNQGRDRLKRRFRFHYDPADVSHVYFYHPDLKRYFPIPYRQLGNPPMSKWECEEAHAELVKLGKSKINERAIVESVKRRRLIESQAASKTKSARRNSERVQQASRTKAKLSLVVGSQAPREPISEIVKRPIRSIPVEDF